MVRAALEILGDHQHIQQLHAAGHLAILAAAVDALHQVDFHLMEQVIHNVIIPHHLAGKGQVKRDIGLNGFMHHLSGFRCHWGQMLRQGDLLAVQRHRQDFADIGRLVSYALHIRDHFQRRRDYPQIAGDGLLH